MNTEQLIQQEANKYASAKAINGVDAKIVRKDFIEGATFGASLNGWVKITQGTMPTKDDVDENNFIEAWNIENKQPFTTTIEWLKQRRYKYSHWRKIVKP